MKKALILLYILLVFLTSCNNVHDSKMSNDSSSNTNKIRSSIRTNDIIESGQIKEDASPELLNADKLVEKFVNGINNSDIDLLLLCVDLYDKRKEGLVKAVEYYKNYFDNSLIVSYELMNKENNGTLRYSLKGTNGKEKVLNISMSESQFIIGFDNFIRFSYYADQKMKSFLEALKTKDINALSFNIWNSMEPVDDDGNLGIYPISKAREVLDKYVQHFDLDTIDFVFTEDTTFENGDGFFVYNIIGKKGNSPTEHRIVVGYGDGQVRISDDWIEPMYSNGLNAYDILDKENDTVIQGSE